MKTLIILIFSIISTSLIANNILVENVKLTGKNSVNNFVLVEFDVSWDNSWRTGVGPSNWDAAWVFVKYRLKSSSIWNHASLNWVDGTGNSDGHTVPANTSISSVNDNGTGNSYGVFIHRNASYNQASVSYTDVQLRWEYGDDGLNDYDSVEVQVYAMEMVYVPQGSFDLGSGAGELNSCYAYPTTSNTFRVNSENAITVGSSSGNLYYNNINGYGGDRTGPIPANYPKGYDSFYVMKYEISQEQYAGFLNNLTASQASLRRPTNTGHRFGMTGSAPGSYSSSNPYVACNHLNWTDIEAFLDWSALRPMTELEFEKVCRGINPAVQGEYPWGSTSLASSTYSIGNSGAANETISNNYNVVGGNATYNSTGGSINGPVRTGIFAANGLSTGRETAGATYYGVMEMGGNVWERAVTFGNSIGRAFTGAHGDGVISFTGTANTVAWPGSSGSGIRGGSWRDGNGQARISDRTFGSRNFGTNRSDTLGGRGVRSAS
jgi:formylglycine-generating enzyme required for sulfatase activity